MTWGEAWRLTQELLADPSSHVAAKVSRWSYATTRDDLTLRALFDLMHQIAWAQGGGKGKRPAAFERPWPVDTGKRTTKPDPSLTQADILAALRFAGHTAPLPKPPV